jgi:hypothetical protein
MKNPRPIVVLVMVSMMRRRGSLCHHHKEKISRVVNRTKSPKEILA